MLQLLTPLAWKWVHCRVPSPCTLALKLPLCSLQHSLPFHPWKQETKPRQMVLLKPEGPQGRGFSKLNCVALVDPASLS